MNYSLNIQGNKQLKDITVKDTAMIVSTSRVTTATCTMPSSETSAPLSVSYTVKDEATFIVLSSKDTTTTFTVSSTETSPRDLSLSLAINGKEVTVERKASRRCVCQGFCCREGLNCWKTTIAFFPEHLLNVSTCNNKKH